MKKSFKYLFFASLLAVSLASGQQMYAADSQSQAADKAVGAAKDSTEKAKPTRDWYPFGGIVASIDTQAKTISLKKKEGVRVLKLDSKSTLEINGKPALLSGVKVGDYAHGKLHKDAAGNEVITAATFNKLAPNKDKPNTNKNSSENPPRNQ
jgi:hypothetical protein